MIHLVVFSLVYSTNDLLTGLFLLSDECIGLESDAQKWRWGPYGFFSVQGDDAFSSSRGGPFCGRSAFYICTSNFGFSKIGDKPFDQGALFAN